MKLKKLLPLAGITGVVAIAAPLVTSCNPKGTTITLNKDDFVEGELPFEIPEYTGETTFATSKKATQAYLNEMSKDLTLFSKEVINSVAEFVRIWNEEEIVIAINTISVRTDKIDSDACKISYSVDVEVKWMGDDNKGTEEYQLEVKNLPVRITGFSNGESPMFTIIPYKHLVSIWNYCELAKTLSPQPLEEVESEVLYELSKDSSWYFSIYQESENTIVRHKIDCSNIYDLETRHTIYLEEHYELWGGCAASGFFNDVIIQNEQGETTWK